MKIPPLFYVQIQAAMLKKLKYYAIACIINTKSLSLHH